MSTRPRVPAACPRCLSWFFVALLGLLAAGCDPRSVVEPIVYAQRGGWSPSTEFDVYRILWDQSIQEELAGQSAGAGQTWKQYWHDRYRYVRQYNKPVVAERMVAYIYQQRQRYGLPLFDDQ